MSIKGFNLAWIVVADIKSAVKFYRDVVGLKLVEFHEEYGWAEFIGHEDGARIGVSQKNDMDPILPGQNAVITLTVENLEKHTQELFKKGVKIFGEVMEIPGQVKLQMCLDQDGNHFQLVQILRSK